MGNLDVSVSRPKAGKNGKRDGKKPAKDKKMDDEQLKTEVATDKENNGYEVSGAIGRRSY